MKKTLLRVAAGMSLFVLLMPVAAHAAVDRAIVHGFGESSPGKIAIATHFMDGGSETLLYNIDMNLGTTTTEQNLLDRANAAVQAFATTQGYSLPNGIVWPYLSPNQVNSLIAAATSSLATVARTGSYNDLSNLPAAPSSYQTIVSQTGTAVPAVSGGFTPMNSYAGAPTFTWARTGAGVYTLTASSAVFNTSGKTGVFVAPLQNLNASVRATVTSSTVITVTTAVQSVAVLGLLGLTTTATDALLANTMIYVQTYP